MNEAVGEAATIEAARTDGATTLYRKVGWRLLPFLLACYVLAYLDRVNVGFAKLGMQSELGLSDAAYGLGAGIFFIGYVLFEVPSNLLQARIGARRTIGRIMLLWGLASMAMMFVQGPWSFYALRFVLGVFEAGFAPGMLFYLTGWYPAERRGQIMAVVLLAGPVGNILGGPLSGWLISSFHGANGLSGWQWMFLIEGLPAVLLGIAAFYYLPDRPAEAGWLTRDEGRRIVAALDAPGNRSEASLAVALRDPRLYAYGLVYYCLISGLYTVSFWLPTLLRDAGIRDIAAIGWLSVVPYLVAVGAMLANARSSDRRRERRWHVMLPTCAGAVGLAVAALAGNLPVAFLGIGLATVGTYAAYAVFWTVPTASLKGTAAAGGIALINSIGALGGFVSPAVIGLAKDLTGSLSAGLLAMAGLLALGAVACAFALAERRRAAF
ncbi:MFS transporter [Methylobacterium sp. OT2]|uniref:MFS transporter n=1 Tax=Methylobacterium sp. OT2 TaxID=2813779 RepID=UPI00197C119C|nr:MFS transporter [Methylobacterium sp. OT2]MBN4096000.1 MFS transporter [Methylobacterium sp. OT2]